MTDPLDRDTGLQGHYAGVTTRLGAFALDVIAIALTFALAAQAIDYVGSVIGSTDFSLKDASVLSDVLLWGWAFGYFAYPLAVSGRTPGMALLGLKVVRADGRQLGTAHAVIRVIALPLSLALFWLSGALVLVRRDRRAIHDLIANTAVVYAWDARSARLRLLAERGTVSAEP